MFQTFINFLRASRDMTDFISLDQSNRKIVFYSEDTFSAIHFENVIQSLVEQYEEEVCYLTSDPEDPILKNHHPKVKPYYVGKDSVRDALFLKMHVDLLIMTMPDLGTFQVKRSKAYPVHYLYMFHAMVSTHSNYRKAAFDNFDTIFCTSPYQISEIRATEKAYALPEKQLVAVGYGKLESLIGEMKVRRADCGTLSPNQKNIIVAPSWGENAILERCGAELINTLLEAGYQTTVRPHPMVTKHKPQLIDSISQQFKSDKNFYLNIDTQDTNPLYESHMMISDWSGVAMEYAFACERPVIFIDVPKKCNNPEAGKIPQIPIEVSIREKIGRVIAPDELHTLPKAIEDIYHNKDHFITQIRKTREESVFNLGSSEKIAAEYIMELAERQWQKNRARFTKSS
jgi:YidC/Oxa1 family membrane protein insertase